MFELQLEPSQPVMSAQLQAEQQTEADSAQEPEAPGSRATIGCQHHGEKNCNNEMVHAAGFLPVPNATLKA